MELLRAAFECEDGVYRIVVLCPACFSDMRNRDGRRRSWHRPFRAVGVACEFCLHEALQDVRTIE